MNKNEALAGTRKRKDYPLLLLCSITLTVLVITIFSVTGKGVHQPAIENLSVNDERPVARAAETLEKKYGWIITYEDPRYAHESEVVDVTEQVRRDLDKFKPGQAPKVFIPKGGALAFDYSIDPVSKKPADSAVVVQQLLNAYAVRNPGVFRLDGDGKRLHIVAIGAKGQNGFLVSHQSVLDVSITVPAQKRNGIELLEAFCAAISKASGTSVVMAAVPLNQFLNHQTESGTKNQKARDFLTHELDLITDQAKLSWRLLYDPGLKTYFLNIHRV